MTEKHFYTARLKDLEIKIRQAEQAGHTTDMTQLTEQFDELTKQLKLLE